MTTYPVGIDNSTTLPPAVDKVTGVDASSFNALRNALLAVETELGIHPASVHGTVSNRMNIVESTVNDISSQIASGSAGIFVAAGDISGNAATQTVVGLRNVAVSSTLPLNGQVLTFDGSVWKPANTAATFTAANDLSGNEASQTVIGLRGRPVSSTAPNTNEALTWNGTAWAPAATFTPATDLSGSKTSQTVVGLQGRSVASTAPNSGEALTWNGSTWTPAATFTPATDLSGSKTSQTVVGLQGRSVASTAPNSGEALTWNGSTWTPSATFTAATDLSGSKTSQTVVAIRNVPVASTSPTTGQGLTYNGSSWAPGSVVSHSATLTGTTAIGDAVIADPTDATKIKKGNAGTFRGIAKAGQTGGTLEYYGIGSTVPASVTGLGAGVDGRTVIVNSSSRLARKEFPTAADTIVGIADASGNVTLRTPGSVAYATKIDLSKYLCWSRDGINGEGAAPPTGFAWNSSQAATQNSRVYLELLARSRAAQTLEFVRPQGYCYFAEELTHDCGKYGFLKSPNFTLSGSTGLLDTWIWNGPSTPAAIGYGYLIPANGGDPVNTKPVVTGTPTVTGELLIRWTDANNFVWRVGRGTASAVTPIGSAVSLTGTGLTVNISAAVDITEVFRVRICAAPTTGSVTAHRIASSTGTITISGTPTETFSTITVKCVKGGVAASCKWITANGEHFYPKLYLTHQAPAAPGMPRVWLRGTPTTTNGTVDFEWRSGTTLADGTFRVRANSGTWSPDLPTRLGRILTPQDGWTGTQQIGWIMPARSETLGCDLYLSNGTYSVGQTTTLTFSQGVTGASIPIPGTGLTATASGTFDEGDYFTFSTTSEPQSFMLVSAAYSHWIDLQLRVENTSTVIPWDVTENGLPNDESPAQQPLTSITFTRCGAQALGYYTSSGQWPRDCFRIGRRRPTVPIGPYQCDFIVFDKCFAQGFANGYLANLDNDSGQAVGVSYRNCVAAQCWGVKRILTGQFDFTGGSQEEIFGPCFKIAGRLDRTSWVKGMTAELTNCIVEYNGNSTISPILHLSDIDHNLANDVPNAVLFAIGGSCGNITIDHYSVNAREGQQTTIDAGFLGTGGGQLTVQNCVFNYPLREIIKNPSGGGGIITCSDNTLSVFYATISQNNGFASVSLVRGSARDETIVLGGASSPLRALSSARISPTDIPILNAAFEVTISDTATQSSQVYLSRVDDLGRAQWTAHVVGWTGTPASTKYKVIATNQSAIVVPDVAPGAGNSVTLRCIPNRTVATSSDPLTPTTTLGTAPSFWYAADYILPTTGDNFTTARDKSANAYDLTPSVGSPFLIHTGVRSSTLMDLTSTRMRRTNTQPFTGNFSVFIAPLKGNFSGGGYEPIFLHNDFGTSRGFYVAAKFSSGSTKILIHDSQAAVDYTSTAVIANATNYIFGIRRTVGVAPTIYLNENTYNSWDVNPLSFDTGVSTNTLGIAPATASGIQMGDVIGIAADCGDANARAFIAQLNAKYRIY